MKIRKMKATFGKLKNSELELQDGLNVICAPNEYGKSTWCAFIKAMLYGIDSSERDKTGYLSAKTRYRPWDGTAPQGSMDLVHEGREITIQRANHGSAAFKSMMAYRTGTADFIKELQPDTVGEALTGVSEHVFERTAYIRRPELRISQTSDLEKRIQSLVFTGDEQTSFTEADEKLRAWQRKLRYNRSGAIPALEKERKAAEDELNAVESISDEISELRSRITRLTAQDESLRADLETHDKIDRRDEARKIIACGEKLRRAEERVNELTEKCTKNGNLMTRQDISDIREVASSVAPLRKVRNDAEKALWQTEKDISDITARKETSPLYPRSEDETIALSKRVSELDAQIKKTKKRRIPKPIPIAIIVIAVALALITSGVLTPFAEYFPAISGAVSFRLWGVLSAAALGILAVFLMLFKPGGGKSEKELSEILSAAGVTSTDKLTNLCAAYCHLLRSEEPATALRDAARAKYDDAARESAEAEEKAVEAVRKFVPDAKSGSDIALLVDETEKALEEKTKAEFELASLRSVYETLKEKFGGEPEVSDEFIQAPLRDREDTLKALARNTESLNEATREFHVATGEAGTKGDPAVIGGHIDELDERLAALEEKYAALTLADEALSEANTTLTTRFSPLISKKAGEYFERLTDGQYEKLSFDRGFDALARRAGDDIGHSVLSLSEGTADEIYFSLRLSMCELILTGSDPCPIILDDALLNFDDERLKEALDLLSKISEERQVIIFTCHSREADLLEGRDGVNIIRA
ncbi:MAG: AAA family ATPase [Oscillospiraceae bacterium]|nr:AAA family ATPase [Oscillospiraceae bacterium]